MSKSGHRAAASTCTGRVERLREWVGAVVACAPAHLPTLASARAYLPLMTANYSASARYWRDSAHNGGQ